MTVPKTRNCETGALVKPEEIIAACGVRYHVALGYSECYCVCIFRRGGIRRRWMVGWGRSHDGTVVGMGRCGVNVAPPSEHVRRFHLHMFDACSSDIDFG
jgi:hypothetical protein